jgi:hypothetical protein
VGHVFDITCRRDGRTADPGRWILDSLVVGRRGVLERLGFTRRRSRREVIAWDRVVALEDDAVVVRDETRPRAPDA